MKRNTIVLFAVLFILAIFAWAGWANWENRRQAAERALASAAKGELVADPAGGMPKYVSPFLGKPAPEFTLDDLSGKKVSLDSYRGKALLINFWATWCAPCKAEIPWFEEFQQAYASRGFTVIGISMDEEGWKIVRPYMQAARINYRIAIGDSALAKKYGGVTSLPETFLIDREGRIAGRHVGIVGKSDYESEIVQLLEK